MCFKFQYGLLASLIFSNIPLVSADSSDTQQPISIEADRAELDERNETSVYQGNVILQQGGIKIKAERLDVFASSGELQSIKAEGNPVEFFQHRENLEDIRGSSMRIEYNAKTRRFLLINQAELWQGNNRFSGERIQFDPDKEKVIATGSPDENGESAKRVQITIQPKAQDQKP